MITLTTAQNALKTVYLDAISAQLNTQIDPIFNTIKQTSSDIYGKNIVKLVPYGLNGGIGTGSEDGALPESAETKYVNFTTTLKNLFGTIEITDKAIRASENDEGAFVNLLTAEMDSLLESSKFNLARMFYGDGTGSLGTISSISSTDNSFVVDNTASLMEGMVLDFYNDGVLDPTMKGVTVTQINRASNTVYVSAKSTNFTSTNATKYKFYIQGSKDCELTGLGAIFGSSTTLYGINRADYASLMPYLYTQKTSGNDTETFDEVFIQTMLDDIEIRSGYQPNIIACPSEVYYKIITFITNYSKNLDSTNFEGGITSVAFSGVPVIRNKFCQKNTLLMLNTEMFNLYQLCDWEWLTNNDGSILRQKEGFPTFSATLVKYADLICNRPNAQGLITVSLSS